MDLKAAAGKQGVDVTQLQSLSGGGDPTQFLTYLAKAGNVRKVGSEGVNGTPTTHYHATIDFEKLAGSADKAATSVRQLEQLSGLKQLPTDIWIDAAQRVRRQTGAIDVKQPLPIKSSLQIDYKRFGVPVDVQAPPADETVDYSAVAGGGLASAATLPRALSRADGTRRTARARRAGRRRPRTPPPARRP